MNACTYCQKAPALIAWRLGFTAALCVDCTGAFVKLLKNEYLTIKELKHYYDRGPAPGKEDRYSRINKDYQD